MSALSATAVTLRGQLASGAMFLASRSGSQAFTGLPALVFPLVACAVACLCRLVVQRGAGGLVLISIIAACAGITSESLGLLDGRSVRLLLALGWLHSAWSATLKPARA